MAGAPEPGSRIDCGAPCSGDQEHVAMDGLLRQANALETEFGYIAGDWKTAGILTTPVEVWGNDLFMDLVESPEVTDHLVWIVTETTIGNNLQRYGPQYSRRPVRFFDVGSDSDVVLCSRLFPCGGIRDTSVCSINMDGQTPDENVKALFQAARDFQAKTAADAPVGARSN